MAFGSIFGSASLGAETGQHIHQVAFFRGQ
jgi:hypothetical protein